MCMCKCEYKDLSEDIRILKQDNERIMKDMDELGIQILEVLSELDYLNRDRFDYMRDEY